MESTAIIQKDQLLLAGFSFFGDPFSASAEWTEENEIGRLWGRFMTYMATHRAALAFALHPETGYEVHLHQPETASTGFFEIFVGVEVATVRDVPVELVIKVLPAAQYALFTLTGQDIIQDWSSEMDDWLTTHDYVSAARYGFQVYDHRFKGMDRLEESAIDAYVPIIHKNDR